MDELLQQPVPSVASRERLRRAGLRVTAARLAVLDALAGVARHLDADGVADAVRRRLGSLSTQAAYDNLRTLVEAGLVRRIALAGGPARYDVRIGDNHHHLVCRRCGAIADVNCAVGEAPCLTAADDAGYEIDEAEVIYWGLCPECLAARTVSNSASMSHQQEQVREERDRRV